MKLRPSISLITGILAGLLLVKAVNVTLELHRLRELTQKSALDTVLSAPVHEGFARLPILLAVLLLIGGVSAVACVGFLKKAPWALRYWLLTCFLGTACLLAAAIWLGLAWGYPIYAMAVAVIWFRESQEAEAAA